MIWLKMYEKINSGRNSIISIPGFSARLDGIMYGLCPFQWALNAVHCTLYPSLLYMYITGGSTGCFICIFFKYLVSDKVQCVWLVLQTIKRALECLDNLQRFVCKLWLIFLKIILFCALSKKKIEKAFQIPAFRAFCKTVFENANPTWNILPEMYFTFDKHPICKSCKRSGTGFSL